ncbi:SsgA family sporulation/cell division regulator [Kitasatospora sp. NBC_01539]|uniref:SsgA family sporulation/cell division regulator n=1 Tax=Kitasatospora sp. NBC_01539 TaxID=2903577 RepID=UPI0038600B47
MRDAVEHESTVHLTGPAAGDMTMLMRYETDDPYAVRLAFLDSGTADEGGSRDGSVTWVMGRELLTVGLTRRCGTGDVTVRPLTPALTELSFAGTHGVAVVHASTRALRAFLRATYVRVAAGSEAAWITVPDDISTLFVEPSAENPT